MKVSELKSISSEKHPLVSVLMTTFNRSDFISAAIESILKSTYTNFELIIVDDCSTDNTVDIIRYYSNLDERIFLYENEKNIGDYPNRNRAASLAKGVFLKYVDADDYIYPSGLSILVKMMSAFPSAGYGLCSLDQDVDKPYPFMLSPREAYIRHYFKSSLFHKAPLSSIIRKESWLVVGGFPEIRTTSDYEMWHKLSAHFDVVLMPSGIVWYREHEAQEATFTRKNPINSTIQYENVIQRSLESSDCPLSNGEKNKIYRRYRYLTLKRVFRYFILFNFRVSMKWVQHYMKFKYFIIRK